MRPWGKLPSRAVSAPVSNDLKAYAALVVLADPHTHRFTHDQRDHAKDLRRITGLDRRSLQRALTSLQEAGLIAAQSRRLPSGAWLPNTYTILGFEAEEVAAELPLGSGENAARVAAELPLGSGENAATYIQRRDLEREELASLVNARAREIDADFEIWIEEYPHKVDEATARTAYHDARANASAAELLDGLRRYKAAHVPGNQWLNPANFLIRQRWRDRPADPAQPSLLLTFQGDRHVDRHPAAQSVGFGPDPEAIRQQRRGPLAEAARAAALARRVANGRAAGGDGGGG